MLHTVCCIHSILLSVRDNSMWIAFTCLLDLLASLKSARYFAAFFDLPCQGACLTEAWTHKTLDSTAGFSTLHIIVARREGTYVHIAHKECSVLAYKYLALPTISCTRRGGHLGMCIHTQLCVHLVYEFAHKYCGLQIPCSIPLGGVRSYNCCTLGLPNQPMPDFNRVRIRSSVVIFPIAYLAPWTIHAFLHSHLQKTYTSCLHKNGLSMTRTRQTSLAQWESALRVGIICERLP